MRVLLIILAVFVSGVALQAQTVYKTPSGQKYHLASCHMVKNVSEAIDLKEAIKIGLEPCKICKPATVTTQPIIAKKPQGQGKTTTQCQGYTKAGTRCKHMTSIANGYCYQHQP
jgi:hypothetical protein